MSSLTNARLSGEATTAGAACAAVRARRDILAAALYIRGRRYIYSLHVYRTALRTLDTAFRFIIHCGVNVEILIAIDAVQIIKRHYHHPRYIISYKREKANRVEEVNIFVVDEERIMLYYIIYSVNGDS